MSNKNKPWQLPSNNQSVVRKTEGVFYSGPLPPPQELQKYNEILPGAADRIMTMAEEQARHRRSLENVVIGSDTRNAKLGLWFGLVTSMTAIITGTITIINGFIIPGTFISGGTIISLAVIFVYGSQKRRKERERKLSQQ
jgi:uncharacterized membrane protein